MALFPSLRARPCLASAAAAMLAAAPAAAQELESQPGLPADIERLLAGDRGWEEL